MSESMLLLLTTGTDCVFHDDDDVFVLLHCDVVFWCKKEIIKNKLKLFVNIFK